MTPLPTINILARLARGSINSSLDADLVALVKNSAPTNADRTTGQQRLALDTTTRTWYYHDGGAATSFDIVGHLAGDRGAWTANTSYVVGDIVTNAGSVYRCQTSNSDAAFTVAKWTDLTASGGSGSGSGGGSGGSVSHIEYRAPITKFDKQTANDNNDVGTSWADLYKTGTTVLETPAMQVHDPDEVWTVKTLGVAYCGGGFMSPIGVEIKLMYAYADTEGGTYSSYADCAVGLPGLDAAMIFRSKLAAGDINTTTITEVSGSGRGGGGILSHAESGVNTGSRTTYVDMGIDWPSTVSNNHMLIVGIANGSDEWAAVTKVVWGQEWNNLNTVATGDSPTDEDAMGIPAGAASGQYWYVGRASNGSVMLANTSGLSNDNVKVRVWQVAYSNAIGVADNTGVAVLSGTLDESQYRDYSPAIEMPIKISDAASNATAGKWVKFKIQFKKPNTVFPNIDTRYGWYLGVSGTQLERLRIPTSVPGTGSSEMPQLIEIDAIEDEEWMRYPASTAGAATTNPGLIARDGTRAISIDLSTAKSYFTTMTAEGSWSTETDATLSAVNYASATSDTIYQPSSTSTGWPTQVGDTGALAIGGKTTIGSTVWGVCVVRQSSGNIETYVKGGSLGWELWDSTNDIIARWSQTPRGKIRLVDAWHGTIGKRNTGSTQEQRWYFNATGNPKTQTRTPSALRDWMAADVPEVRGTAPGGTYTAAFSESGVNGAGVVYYNSSERKLVAWAKTDADAPWLDAALRKGAAISVTDSSSGGPTYIFGTVSTAAAWNGSKVTAYLDVHNLIASANLPITPTYNIEAHGTWLTWDDYATAPLPLSDSLFTTAIGDVHRYGTGLSDAPESTKRGLVWRVGDSHLVVYDEDNVQWTNRHVQQTTFGSWGTATAPSAVGNIDTVLNEGLYLCGPATGGRKPEAAISHFYFAVVGTGQWRYQIAWVKLLDTSQYLGYDAKTDIGFTAAGDIYVTGNNSSRTVKIFPNSGDGNLAGELVVGNSLVLHNRDTNEFISGDISAVSDNPGNVTGSKQVTLINGAHVGELVVGDVINIETQRSPGVVFRARQNVSTGGASGGWTFAGVNWSYSVIDLRLYFATTDLNAETEVGRTRGFEADVTNPPTGNAKRGLTFFNSSSGKQLAATMNDTTYANDIPVWNYQDRTYSVAHLFKQENWHNVPGLDTTSIGYDFVLSRTLVTGRHPGVGELSLNRAAATFTVNISGLAGSTEVASSSLSRIVPSTVIQLEQPANGRRWTARVNSVTRIGTLGTFACTLLEDRGSEHFFEGSEIKLFGQGLGTGELPIIDNLDTVTDALRGQIVQFEKTATGRPWDEDGFLWIGSEPSGPFYPKNQRAFSTESLRMAQRTETLTLGSWSTAVAATDIVAGASDLNLNSAAIDSLTSVPSTATNKPGSVAGAVYTRQHDDGTRSQVFIAATVIAWRTTTTAAPTTYGSWTTGEPADSIMDRIPNASSGWRDPRPLEEFRWAKKTSTLGGPPASGANHYNFTRIVPGDSDRAFSIEIYYLAGNIVRKVTRSAVETYGGWDSSAHTDPVITHHAAQTVGSAGEFTAGSIQVTMLPGLDYVITFDCYSAGNPDNRDASPDRHVSLRIREGGITGTQRALIQYPVPKNSGYYQAMLRCGYRDLGSTRTTIVTRTYTCTADMLAAGQLAGGNWRAQAFIRAEPAK